MFYSIYFFQKNKNIQKINISYVYVEHDNLENVLTLERQYLERYISDLVKMIISLESDTEFKKNPNRLCDYCKFQTHCNNDT